MTHAYITKQSPWLAVSIGVSQGPLSVCQQGNSDGFAFVGIYRFTIERKLNSASTWNVETKHFVFTTFVDASIRSHRLVMRQFRLLAGAIH